MQATLTSPPSDLQARFEKAIEYFKRREEVIFANESVHFWEQHGFVQQSLAKLLIENGIRVTWYDSFGWRSYHPVLSWHSSLLSIKSVFRFPGDRFPVVKKMNDRLVALKLSKELLNKKNKPVFWVQASLSESIAQSIPWIDVYSVFDDPYCHAVGDSLLEKVKFITCQNQYSFDLIGSKYAHKSKLLFPPFKVDLQERRNRERISLPEGFPQKVMGYIGTFMGEATDFGLVEYLLQHAPEWGVLFAGRTDSAGRIVIEKLKKNPRFIHFEWMPPHQLMGLWNAIDVTILPYRQVRVNDGAFPVKVLESLGLGIPIVATLVHKTSSLAGSIPRTSFPDEFLELIEIAHERGQASTKELYRFFASEMEPKLHLVQVAEYLNSGLERISKPSATSIL